MGLTEKLVEIKAEAEALTEYANGVTGGSDIRLGDAVRTLADGFGQGGDSQKWQATFTLSSKNSSSYAETDTRLTVEKSGIYTIRWLASRPSSNSGFATRLYISGSPYGSEFTYFAKYNTQSAYLADVALNAGDILSVYSKGGTSSQPMVIGYLIIQERK